MVFNRATFGKSANLWNAYGEESGGGGNNDDDDIDEGHDDVWYSIEQHLKGSAQTCSRNLRSSDWHGMQEGKEGK